MKALTLCLAAVVAGIVHGNAALPTSLPVHIVGASLAAVGFGVLAYRWLA